MILNCVISGPVNALDPNVACQFSASMRVTEVADEPFRMLAYDALKVPACVSIRSFEGRFSENISEGLERNMCSTLLFWGYQDHRRLRSDQSALIGTIPETRLEAYQGAGPLHHLEESRLFASDIAAFAEEFISKGES